MNTGQDSRFHPIREVAVNLFLGVQAFVPSLLAVTVFVVGCLLVFAGAIPPLPSRLEWLERLMPLPLVELSHFMGSIAGVALILIARGLQLRLNFAFHVSRALLLLGVIFSLVRGLAFEEAAILLAIVIVLSRSKEQFYRKASFLSQSYTQGWIIAIFVALLCAGWIGFFYFRHVEYTSELWWRFAFRSDVSRFLRAGVGVSSLTLIFILLKWMSGGVNEDNPPGEDALETANQIVRSVSRADANLVLLGDKQLLFDDSKQAFIMYAVENNSWIALGDPVGPESLWEGLLLDFRELCDQHAGIMAFYKVDGKHLFYYVDLGMHSVKIGEEARLFLPQFRLEDSARRELRQTNSKVTRAGCTFEIIPVENVPPVLPRLKEISDAWLKEKNAKEKQFSLGFFREAYIRLFPQAIVRKGDRIIAFANIWKTVDKQELSIDLMRYAPDEPLPGLMDYLFVQLMLWGKQEGYQYFSLGVAPLAGLDNHPLMSRWNRLGLFVVRHGEHFYNFEGLHYYKNKFDPQWEPKYLACSSGFALPKVLKDLTGLVGGGMRGIVGV